MTPTSHNFSPCTPKSPYPIAESGPRRNWNSHSWKVLKSASVSVCPLEEISGQLVSRSTTTHASDGQNLPRAEITLPLWVTHTHRCYSDKSWSVGPELYRKLISQQRDHWYREWGRRGGGRFVTRLSNWEIQLGLSCKFEAVSIITMPKLTRWLRLHIRDNI